MIIVLGRVEIRADCLALAREISDEHVKRSRLEPGCLSHAVYEDPDRPGHLVFVEEWASDLALKRHFEVPESIEFAQHLSRLASSRPVIRLLQATEIPFPRGA